MSDRITRDAADASTLHRLRGRFSNEQERSFRSAWLQNSLGQIRMTLIVGSTFYALFGILDFILIPTLAPALWAIRFGVVVPFALAVLAFSLLSRFHDLLEILMTAWMLLAGLGVVAMVSVVPREVGYSYYAGLILVFIVGYTWARIRFVWASVAGWIIVAAYEFIAIDVLETPTQMLIANNFFFVGANILGMISCHSFERYARKDFLMTRRLQEEKEHARKANLSLEEANTALARLARADSLTGIPNRRAFDSALEREWRSAQRSGGSLALIMGDVDHFKRYNDALGHLAGDDCLRAVAKAIAAQARRPSDMAARYGGEEFAVLLPDTDAKGALHLAEQIGAAVRSLAVQHPDSPAGDRVTLSLGVGILHPQVHQDRSLLVSIADEALYDAKAAGRDRVELRHLATLPGPAAAMRGD